MNYQQLGPDVTVPGAEKLLLPCVGDLTPNCPAMGDALAAAGLAGLLEKANIAPSELGDIYGGAFSAGGSLWKRLLMRDDYRAATKSLILSDATWTTWMAPGQPIPMEGFVRYALDVIKGGDKLFIATSSPSYNKSHPNGHESLRATQQEIEKRIGRPFEKIDAFFNVDPKPTETYRLGNVTFAFFPKYPLGHGHTSIAPQLWRDVLVPWLQNEPKPKQPDAVPLPSFPGEMPFAAAWGVAQWLALAGGSALGFGVTRLFRRALS